MNKHPVLWHVAVEATVVARGMNLWYGRRRVATKKHLGLGLPLVQFEIGPNFWLNRCNYLVRVDYRIRSTFWEDLSR